jgi:hypothetical protein
MRLPEITDLALFSAWDGYLLAMWLLLMSALVRKLCDLTKRDSSSMDMVVARWTAKGARAGAVIMGLVGWQLCPDRGPGLWGALFICGMAMTYGNAIWMVRKGKPLF